MRLKMRLNSSKHILLAIIFFLSIFSCSEESKTTSTTSSSFSKTSEKIDFLNRYVTFRREYQSLEFSINYIDGSSGRLPGPTEYQISIFAAVPPSQLKDWISGCSPAGNTHNKSWFKEIPGTQDLQIESFAWFKADGKTVGISQEKSQVAYHAFAR